MYILRPPQERAKYAAITQVGKLKDEHNKTVYEKWPIEGKAPRALRALPGVPDQVDFFSPKCFVLLTIWPDILQGALVVYRAAPACDTSSADG